MSGQAMSVPCILVHNGAANRALMVLLAVHNGAANAVCTVHSRAKWCMMVLLTVLYL